jgi:hypothetical protein
MDQTMNELLGSLSIYRKGEEPRLLLMHYAPLFDDRGSYKGDGCWGDLESIDLGKFETEGLEIVQRSLKAYATRRRMFGPTDRQGFDLWKPAKRQQFFREHADVGVSQRENGELWLDPTTPRTVGFSGMSDEALRIIIPARASSAEFFAGVIESLKR